MMESSPASIAPLLVRNLLTSLFIYADKSLGFFAEKSKLLEALRYIIISSFLFFLRLLPSFFPSLNNPSEDHKYNTYPNSKPILKGENYVPQTVGGGGLTADSGIARALSQLLSIVNDIPVSSRKYEVVRSLAEKLIDENLLEGNEALREVNCNVLSVAFARTLSQLESVVLEQGRSHGGLGSLVIGGSDATGGARDGGGGDYINSLSRLMKAVKYCGDVLLLRGSSRDELSRSDSSAEKLAAELLWLAQKMAVCGCADEAVYKWAAAAGLAWHSLTTEARLQGSIVKISAFLLKHTKVLGKERSTETTKEQERQTKVKMLLLWIPLLCQASMGTDSPVLSVNERAELEKTLEDIIEDMEQQEDQEKVLALWLHHFTYCPSSDWPNLNGCYTRWCKASRRNLLRTKRNHGSSGL